MSTSISGELHVANDVLVDLVAYAAADCYGVVAMSSSSQQSGLSKLLPLSRVRKGIVVETLDEGIHVDLYVIIEYGTNINTVSQNLVDQVSFALTQYAQVPLAGVEVHVEGVRVRKH